ncbi:hypothetical protein GCM10009654_00400 [Streptomyces hebeiensis]
MTEPVANRFGSVPSRASPQYGQGSSANLADILERVLDKGIVIAGDIQINLLDIELLTIKLRLLVASVDKAKEMGIDWWEHDPSLSSRAGERPSLAAENRRLRAEVEELRGDAALEPAEERPRARRAIRGTYEGHAEHAEREEPGDGEEEYADEYPDEYAEAVHEPAADPGPAEEREGTETPAEAAEEPEEARAAPARRPARVRRTEPGRRPGRRGER